MLPVWRSDDSSYGGLTIPSTREATGRAALVARTAWRINDGFDRYNQDFRRITARAKKRFVARDWKGQMADIARRVELYEQWAQRTVKHLHTDLGDQITDHKLWEAVREYFGRRIEDIPDAGFAKTFYNSITRRVFGTRG
ncbi:MAG: bifunctional isocitrate dehydrogenase kinase/phosphatase, partial [Gammaproteobacteria bacterium]|nr:bifunctional isocitrate dehydrogenase kinase/phosphatase [Gammaproteobacteria bacterium]